MTMVRLSAIKKDIMDYLEFKAHTDKTIRGDIVPLLITHTEKGELLIRQYVEQLVAEEYISLTENPATCEILIGNQWRISFGSPRTFKIRDHARAYVSARWGEYDPKSRRNDRPIVVLNEKWKGTRKDIPLTAVKSLVIPKEKQLKGKDPLTVALNAVVEIATLPGWHHAHASYHRHLAVEVSEAVLRDCKGKTEECGRKECANKCWAKKTIASFQIPKALKAS